MDLQRVDLQQIARAFLYTGFAMARTTVETAAMSHFVVSVQ